MTEAQGKAILREGFQGSKTATVYKVVFNKAADRNNPTSANVDPEDKLGHDTTSVTIIIGRFPSSMEKSNRIAETIVNNIQSLTASGKMDTNGLFEVLFQGMDALKEAGLLTSQNQLKASLPKEAPASWEKDKIKGETPPAFIMRNYAPWIGKGLGRADIRHLDSKLYIALRNWLRANTMPENLDLPTVKERNDRWIDQVASSPKDYSDFTAREAWRLRSAQQRRNVP